MKLQLGFVRRDSRLVMPVFFGLWASIVLLVIVSLYLLVARFNLQAQNTELTEEVAELQWKLDKNKALLEGAPSLSEFRDLQQRIRVINELAGQQGAGLSSVLSRLEQLLPDQAYLTNFSYKPEKNEMLLTVEAPGADQLTSLLQAAEESQRFSEVLLTRQSQEKREGQRLIQFEIRLTTRQGQVSS